MSQKDLDRAEDFKRAALKTVRTHEPREPGFQWRIWLPVIGVAVIVGTSAWVLSILPSINAISIVRDILVLAYLFVLRLGVPLLITLMLGSFIQHGLQQQDAKEMRASNQFGITGAPCWEKKDCPENVRAHCVAFQRPELPCWLALQVAGYGLKEQCYSCPQYTTRPATIRA